MNQSLASPVLPECPDLIICYPPTGMNHLGLGLGLGIGIGIGIGIGEVCQDMALGEQAAIACAV